MLEYDVRGFPLHKCTCMHNSKTSLKVLGSQQRQVPCIHRSFIHDSCQAGLNSTLLTVPAYIPWSCVAWSDRQRTRAPSETHDDGEYGRRQTYISCVAAACQRCDMILQLRECVQGVIAISQMSRLAAFVKQAQTWQRGLDGLVCGVGCRSQMYPS